MGQRHFILGTWRLLQERDDILLRGGKLTTGGQRYGFRQPRSPARGLNRELRYRAKHIEPIHGPEFFSGVVPRSAVSRCGHGMGVTILPVMPQEVQTIEHGASPDLGIDPEEIAGVDLGIDIGQFGDGTVGHNHIGLLLEEVEIPLHS